MSTFYDKRCHSCELWLNTIRNTVAHMNFRHVPTLRSANTLLVYVPICRERLLVLRGFLLLLFYVIYFGVNTYVKALEDAVRDEFSEFDDVFGLGVAGSIDDNQRLLLPDLRTTKGFAF